MYKSAKIGLTHLFTPTTKMEQSRASTVRGELKMRCRGFAAPDRQLDSNSPNQ
jgi:hypothetical protein